VAASRVDTSCNQREVDDVLENTSGKRKVLAGLVGTTLVLGLAVSAGTVPRPGDNGRISAAAVSTAEELAASTARQPGDIVETAEAAPTTVEPTTTLAPTTVPKPKTTIPPRAAKAPTAAAKSAPSSTAAAAPAAPAAPVTVPRRVPSTAEVSQAIATLPQYVSTIFTPTPAQVAQIGNEVCTAFDQGQTFAQVKTTGLQMVTQVPLTTIKPGGADWVVKTVVALYCPGHASKLV
jgi:hypothetical protein